MGAADTAGSSFTALHTLPVGLIQKVAETKTLWKRLGWLKNTFVLWRRGLPLHPLWISSQACFLSNLRYIDGRRSDKCRKRDFLVGKGSRPSNNNPLTCFQVVVTLHVKVPLYQQENLAQESSIRPNDNHLPKGYYSSLAMDRPLPFMTTTYQKVILSCPSLGMLISSLNQWQTFYHSRPSR